MTTNFLPVGMINEQLQEIAELAAQLVCYEGADQQVTEIGARLYELTTELLSFINGFTSQPLIFTGQGSTEEIIARLEWLLTFADGEPQTAPLKTKKVKPKSS